MPARLLDRRTGRSHPLRAVGERKLALGFERLGNAFGAYVEWGQPIHDVGDDVKKLALPAKRPDTLAAFRMLCMLCRHSRYVQEFGTVRDADEIARRERLWERAIDEIEFAAGQPAASFSAVEFRAMLEERVDVGRFREL